MPNETDERGNSCPKRRFRPIDARIADLAARQHGVIASRQLYQLGLDRYAIRYRLRIGRLHRIHRGVYSVGHASISAMGRCMAAVLQCGPSALLSHRSAGWLWGLRPSGRSAVEVTAPVWLRRDASIECRASRVPGDERSVFEGIPVTSVPRTLLDLATVLQPHQLERAIEQAEVLRLTDPLSLPVLLERYPRRRGTAALRRILAERRIGASVTRSELERRFLEFVGRLELPRPQVNAPLFVAGRWIEVDCLWRAERVALELDSRAVHATVAAFESDRARDRRLQAERWRPVRITWRQLVQEEPAVEADLRALLGITTSRHATP